MIFGLILWAELFGFYLLFTDHVGRSALLAGGPAALGVAAFALVLHRAVQRRGEAGSPPLGHPHDKRIWRL